MKKRTKSRKVRAQNEPVDLLKIDEMYPTGPGIGAIPFYDLRPLRQGTRVAKEEHPSPRYTGCPFCPDNPAEATFIQRICGR